MAMRFQTRRAEVQTFDDGSSAVVYTISDGDRLIGSKTIRYPATGPRIEITYQLGDQTFDNPDAFMMAYLKAHTVTA